MKGTDDIRHYDKAEWSSAAGGHHLTPEVVLPLGKINLNAS